MSDTSQILEKLIQNLQAMIEDLLSLEKIMLDFPDGT